MGFYDEEEFEDSKIVKQEKQLIGYCAYNKEEIHEGDDIVIHKGKMYLRENFIQASLGTQGEIIDPEEQ